MSTCSRCGNPVEFRYVNGRCIPMHLYGGCIGSGNSGVNDYSGYNASHESTCFCTKCPECGEEVFFIRHNGGSVWIDPPLGPPWYKHGCFEQPGSASSVRSSLAVSYSINDAVFQEGQELIVGIVKTTYVDYQKTHTEITLETGKSEKIELRIKNNAGFLLGKLCIYSKSEKLVWPIEEPDYKFEIYSPQKPKPSKPQQERHELISCPECGVPLNPKNLNKHLRRQHDHS